MTKSITGNYMHDTIFLSYRAYTTNSMCYYRIAYKAGVFNPEKFWLET